MGKIRRASSANIELGEAIKEVSDKLTPKQDNSFSILFISDEYNVTEHASSIKEYFGENVIGCTTAGEITETGFSEKSVSGITFSGEGYLFENIQMDDLDNIDTELIKKTIDKARSNETTLGKDAKTFCVILIDGLSVKEEMVAGLVGNLLNGIPLVGGSAGDGLNFEHSYVYSKNCFSEDSATLLFVTTSQPFEVVKLQHFVETDVDIVITGTIPEKRIVTEINGEPAAKAYADILGIQVDVFSPMIFSRYPLMLKLGDDFYVRSIQKVNPDGSLTFYCAIEDGLVLTLAEKKDFFEHVKNFSDEMKGKFGEIDCSLFFECILRRLEVIEMDDDEKSKVDEVYSSLSACGFHTYGEQLGAVHINHTLTGVIFGK